MTQPVSQQMSGVNQTSPPNVEQRQQVAMQMQVSQSVSAPKSEPVEVVDAEKLAEMVDKIQEIVAESSRDIAFRVDKETGTTQVIVMRESTQEIIRKIPSDEVLTISKNIENYLGLVLNKTA